MAIVDLKIGNLSLQIESEEKEKILMLADEVNGRVNHLKSNLKGLTDIKAILITVLMLQDEVTKAKNAFTAKAQAVAEEQNQALTKSFYELLDHVGEKINELAKNLIK
ncbi:MAG: cell division protein ZapA [Candidatus Midichloria sp.]|nr:cell division protein ZapA [Candidatus Midichloria sp.]